MLNITLFQHQLEAVELMTEVERKNDGLGSVLAHDMGLGKTLTSIAFLLQKRREDNASEPDLIICPLAVLFQWKEEILRFDPNQKVFIYHGKNRKEKINGEFDFVIGTYHNMITKELHHLKWNTVVLDEAHYIRNCHGRKNIKVPKKADGVFEMKNISKNRLCITGTPFNNRQEDVQSLMVFLGYSLEMPVEHFIKNCVIQKSKEGIIKPFITHMIPIESPEYEKQKSIEIYKPYEDAYGYYLKYIGMMRNCNNIVESQALYNKAMGQMMKMKIFCDLFITFVKLKEEYYENPEDETEESEPDSYHEIPFTEEQMLSFYESSPKIKTVCDKIIELLPKDPNNKILVFSSFVTVLNILECVINSKQKYIKTLKYTGSMSKEKRNESIVAFTEDKKEPTVLLASLTAGNCGINLVPCSTVFLVDIPLNPFEVLQGVNRVHRITQKNEVNVYQFYMEKLIEKNILTSHKKKIDLSTKLGLNII